jgi:hypothetical protein
MKISRSSVLIKKWRHYLPASLFLAFLFSALVAFFQSRPAPKNARIYQMVQRYSPYYLDKRFGGLTIHSKEDSTFEEKPNSMILFKEFERLERDWGKSHIQIQNAMLIILDDNGSVQTKIPLHSNDERQFVRHYYGVE